MSLKLVPRLLFLASLLFSAYFSLAYLDQPIHEAHGFRQAQTALTAYYLIENGFSLAYWTPVVGQGWSIPFEFPLYQQIVATLVEVLGTPLTATGRAVSWLFLLATCVPLHRLLRELGADRDQRLFALALFLSAPLYVFWGSTFLIETTALFLTMCFAVHGTRIVKRSEGTADYVLTFVFLTLGLLQKATTGLPVAVVFSLALVLSLRRPLSVGELGRLVKGGLAVGAAVLIAYLWVRFTDQVKQGNPIGAHLTSQALGTWNYGLLEHRFSKELWRETFWRGLLLHNLAGVAGVAVILAALAGRTPARLKAAIGAALALGLLPLLLFTNLHIHHDYYRTANLVFFLLALALAVGALGARTLSARPLARALLLCLFIGSNFYHFATGYHDTRTARIDPRTDRVLRLTGFVRDRTAPGDVVVWYGFDWSSEFAFYSERKSVTVPAWEKLEQDVIFNTARYVDTPPSAIVLCTTPRRSRIRQAVVERFGQVASEHIDDCEVFFPGRPAALAAAAGAGPVAESVAGPEAAVVPAAAALPAVPVSPASDAAPAPERTMGNPSILEPVFALAEWTAAVLLLILVTRVRAGLRREIRTDDFKYGKSPQVPARVSIPNRNYMSLLELPVLFYVACVILYVAPAMPQAAPALAWSYVALRVVHSLIHLTYNHVIHRLAAFGLSNVVLAVLWILAWQAVMA